MRDDMIHPYRVVIVTLDAHSAGSCERIAARLTDSYPGLVLSIHAASTWNANPQALESARADIDTAHMIIANMLFLEEHVRAVLPNVEARRDHADAVIGLIADPAIVRMTRMGELDMSAPASMAMQLLRRLRGGAKNAPVSGARQMRMLRRLPRILRLIPGKAQDLRAWFLTMQYWLGGSDANIEQMLRFLLGRYAHQAQFAHCKALPPVTYPEVGLYHPDLPGIGVTEDPSDLPGPENPVAVVGVLMLRSYILSEDTAHYDAAIRSFEEKGMKVIPAFASGLDARPAIEAYFGENRIDAIVSLTGFSLVGGPAYNDSSAAVETLKALDVPYIAAQALEFQTLGQWAKSAQGLGPVETTMLVALPELDGATNPTVFAGRLGAEGCSGCKIGCKGSGGTEIVGCPERISTLAEKVRRLAVLRRKKQREKTVAIVLFGFPPNAGAVGTAAYLSVFESLYNLLRRMSEDGYEVDLPPSVEALREMVLEGNAQKFGQEANVAAHVSADTIVRTSPFLTEIERTWGPVPGRVQSDGQGVFILGRHFGKVFVGVQPAFGFEGDPMRLLFEGNFAPTHAFAVFYQWIRDQLEADVILHFGMHGALEFMPGKQTGPSASDWPDRLIGEMPNVYLYAANNPSEATLAKRRTNAVTVSHLTPPLTSAGLYKGLSDLKDSLSRWRGGDRDDQLAELITAQAEDLDFGRLDPDELWLKVLETEGSLIPAGLHVVGRPMEAEDRAALLDLMPLDPDSDDRQRVDRLLQEDGELTGLMRALSARFIDPVPGGDIIRSPEILPTGRNIHAFDPFRMPTAHALAVGAQQAQALLETHGSIPRSVALVLWGSDNIKTDGAPIAQALALIGAKPRFDSYGRLAGADLVPLAELGRPRVDVVMTLSGIFRDLLPLQTKMLAEAAWKAANADDEPLEMNPIRAHSLAHHDSLGCDFEEAALRVFSNAEGAYGSNVNHLVDSSAFGDEDELADAYQARKSFAYSRDGKSGANKAMLQQTLNQVELAYQNLESVELGVTSIDHYFDTLGGIARAVRRARGKSAPVYIGDSTRGKAKVRTLQDQVALETRSRSLNPKFYDLLLEHGHEGVRQIEAHITNTMGWSATTGEVQPWIYQRLSETFVLDPEMRERLASQNPKATMRMAGRLLEASDRQYWQPDAATLTALQEAANALEDRIEGVAAE